MNVHCRIGRIKPKGNLAVVRPKECSYLASRMLNAARIIAGNSPPERSIAGYAIVAWWADGTRSEGWAVDPKGPIGDTMVPMLAHDILTRRITDPREN